MLVLCALKSSAAYLTRRDAGHLSDAVFRNPVPSGSADGVIALAAIPTQAVVGCTVDCKLRRWFYASALSALLLVWDVVSAGAGLLLFPQRVTASVLAGLAVIAPAVAIP